MKSNPAPRKVCPLCEREIPPDHESRHHLIPRLRGGKMGPVAILHPICHSKIHSVFSETELARDYCTIERLRNHEEMSRFISWVKTKPIAFRAPTREKSDKSRRRKK